MATYCNWTAPAYFELSEDATHAYVVCSNQHNCRKRLPVSFEDAQERTVPKVEGWRSEERKDGLYAFCARCSEELLPKEGF